MVDDVVGDWLFVVTVRFNHGTEALNIKYRTTIVSTLLAVLESVDTPDDKEIRSPLRLRLQEIRGLHTWRCKTLGTLRLYDLRQVLCSFL